MIIALLALIMLCAPTFGQTTAEEWFDKGVALMNQNKYDEATQAFENAIEINPQYVEAWVGKGWSLFGHNKYNDALKIYNKAIELNPNYADAWAGKGFAFLALDFKHSEPLDAFNHAIVIDPNYGLAWIGELFLFWCFDESTPIDTIDKAPKLSPSSAETILSGGYGCSSSFERQVFLREGCPRTAPSLNTAPVPVPQKKQ